MHGKRPVGRRRRAGLAELFLHCSPWSVAAYASFWQAAEEGQLSRRGLLWAPAPQPPPGNSAPEAHPRCLILRTAPPRLLPAGFGALPEPPRESLFRWHCREALVAAGTRFLVEMSLRAMPKSAMDGDGRELCCGTRLASACGHACAPWSSSPACPQFAILLFPGQAQPQRPVASKQLCASGRSSPFPFEVRRCSSVCRLLPATRMPPLAPCAPVPVLDRCSQRACSLLDHQRLLT